MLTIPLHGEPAEEKAYHRGAFRIDLVVPIFSVETAVLHCPRLYLPQRASNSISQCLRSRRPAVYTKARQRTCPPYTPPCGLQEKTRPRLLHSIRDSGSQGWSKHLHPPCRYEIQF